MSREPKIDRKALKKPDTFVQKGREAFETLFRERRIAYVALAAVVAGLGAYYGYEWYSNRSLNKGWVAFYKAEEAKLEELSGKLKQAYEQGGSTRAAFISAVTLGDHYSEAARRKIEAMRIKAAPKDAKAKPKADEGDESKKDLEPSLSPQQSAKNAGEWYGKALSFSSLLPGERELLTLDSGHAEELQENWDGAAAKYKAAMEMNGQSKPLAMIHLGRMHEMKKDPDAAKTIYRSVGQEFANTEYATTAKNYLRRMDSALLAPGKQ